MTLTPGGTRLRGMRIGVLTGGGDCPGLNAVIRAVVRKGVTAYGHEFVGYRDGWRGPVEGVSRPLEPDVGEHVVGGGGTLPGSSRTNPYKLEGAVDGIRTTLADAVVEALVAIGGE